MNEASITSLHIYPVKSLKGIALKKAELTSKGLLHDRHWMVIQENGRFATQRDFPRMSLIHTALDEEGLHLSMQDMDPIRISYELQAGRVMDTSVWGARCRVIDQGVEVSQWLTRALALETPVHLVRMEPDYVRPQMKADFLGTDTTTDFADAAPFLITNEASLVQLNFVLMSKQLESVLMDRFRPNIVVRGIEPFAEHKLSGMNSDRYSLDVCYPCERCIVTTINQQTAHKDPRMQPFRTLQKINPMPGGKKAPAFGENAILTGGKGEIISVGDRLQVNFNRD